MIFFFPLSWTWSDLGPLTPLCKRANPTEYMLRFYGRFCGATGKELIRRHTAFRVNTPKSPLRFQPLAISPPPYPAQLVLRSTLFLEELWALGTQSSLSVCFFKDLFNKSCRHLQAQIPCLVMTVFNVQAPCLTSRSWLCIKPWTFASRNVAPHPQCSTYNRASRLPPGHQNY